MADVKPTPTQEENDRAAMGEHVVDKEHDGSPPDPGVLTAEQQRKTVEAGRPGGYQTRQATAAPPRQSPRTPA